VRGGAGTLPGRQVEEYLMGETVDEIDPGHEGGLALPKARPISDNAYKVVLASNVVKRTVDRLLKNGADIP